MSFRIKVIIIVVAFAQILLIMGLFFLPKAVLAIPGRYRVALAEKNPFLSSIAEGVIEQVAPVVTALPVAQSHTGRPMITIPAFQTVDSIEALTPASPAAGIVESTPPAENNANVQTTPATEEPTPAATPTSTPTPTITPTPTPLPRQVRLNGIKRIQQSFNNCGPANLTQVLNWYGDDTTQEIAASYLKPNPEDRNVSPWQLSDYVNDFTELRSTVHSGGDLELVKRFIAAGYPVVIEKGYEPNTSSSQGWFGHYLTVFGYDEDQRVIYSMDTYLKVDETLGRADSYEEFEYYWGHFNYSFYVVYEPEEEAEVFGMLGPDMLEPLKMWEKTAMRAQADVKADPENAFAWFNLGTSLTRMGELTGNAEYYQQGAVAFDEARSIGLPPRMLWYEFRPYLAYMKVGRYEDMIEIADTILSMQGGQNVEETYLYKGHALLYQGDVAGAAAAYRKAIELNENFYPAKIALQSIS